MKRPATLVALLAPVCWLVPASTYAQTDPMERQRLSQQRAQVEADFVRGKAECERQFVVTSCIDALQERRRSQLSALRQQEVELDDRQRAADAQLAQQRLHDKQAKAAARSGRDRAATPPAASAPLAPPAAPATPAAAPPASAAQAGSVPPARQPSARAQHQQDQAVRAAAAAQADSAAAQRAAAQQQRLREAAERRERVEQRNAQRAAQGKTPASLPDPPAASAAQR